MSHRFRVGDVVESEWFSDIGEITEVNNNSVKVRDTWYLAKNVELTFRPLTELKTEQPLKGRKDDAEKPDLSLLPREALEATARAFEYGAKKYGRYNYIQGMDWHRIIAAAMRHITAFNAGEDKDKESGLSHLAHASAAINMLIVYEVQQLGKDTRFKP